jgi:carboxyl-terminal processing protease
MNFKTLFLITFLFLSYTVFAQNKTCALLEQTQALMQKRHIQPLQFSKATFHEVLNIYLYAIDPECLFFTKQDSFQLHVAIAQSKNLCDVFTLSKPIVLKRLNAHDSLLQTLNLAYIGNEQSAEKFQIPCEGDYVYQENTKALHSYAKKYFKYSFLVKKYRLQEAKIELSPQQILNAIVLKQRTHINKLMTEEKQLGDLFLASVCVRYDPHSAFFDSAEKDIWDAHLQKDELSFGFRMELTENEQIKIAEVMPGGAAWNSKQMEEGDFIDQIELSNGKKFLVGIDADLEIYEAIKSKNNMEVTFYLTKVDGSKLVVKLIKSKFEVSNNVINGYIFKKDNQKLGYIELPSFYSDNLAEGRAGCSSDLAREILQLKRDSISGLIIDLRNNGGGYLYEALAIAGLFIDEGVLAIKQERNDNKPRYLKDPNRGTVYDGKLIILVNQYSASASEMLAGVLQQYHRAIIVGKTTFGKATMQQVLPLDSAAEMNNTNQYYVSVTMGKFYMINKTTTQLKGVVPDIALPNVYDYLEHESEESYNYTIPSDSVNKLIDVKPYPVIDFVKLKTKSDARIPSIHWADRVERLADSMSLYSCQSESVLLTTKTVFAWEKARNNFFHRIQNSRATIFESYPVMNTSIYNELLKDHQMYMKANQYKLDEFKRDLTLFETINILSDYINQP